MASFYEGSRSQFFEQLRLRCIQLGSSVGCSRVPQVHLVRKHFVRKQTMCKSLYTYLTVCFAFEKPRWLLHNTADRAETVFSHLNFVTLSFRFDIPKTWVSRYPRAAGSSLSSEFLRQLVDCCLGIFLTSVLSKILISTRHACSCLDWPPFCVLWQARIGHWCCMLW